MNEAQFSAQTNSLRRLWGWMIEERHGERGAEILDGILDEWWLKFQGLDVDTFAACVEWVKSRFRPGWNEPFPSPKWIDDALEVLNPRRQDDQAQDDEENPRHQEYLNLLAKVQALPSDKYRQLANIARPRVEKMLKAGCPAIASKGLWAGEMVRAYCEANGRKCPI